MTTHVGAPDLRFQGRLVWPFDEDAVTTAWEMLRALQMPPGSVLGVDGLELPEWWWNASGMQHGEGGWQMYGVAGEHGEAVVLSDEGVSPIAGTLVRALAAARRLDVAQHDALAEALAASAEAADFPLGAQVTAARHDDVLVERLRWAATAGDLRVVTWTRMAPGTAPAEFMRRQRASGAYSVVMVAAQKHSPAAAIAGDDRAEPNRTVGIWTGTEEPQIGASVRPVLRRLYIREGAWRYGMAFAPIL